MTKPSYEELVRYWALCDEHAALLHQKSLPYAACVRCLLASSEQKRYAAESENLRVRGLLQRQSEVLQRVASWDFDFYGDCVAEAKKLASDALSQQNGNGSSSIIGAFEKADALVSEFSAKMTCDCDHHVLAIIELREWLQSQAKSYGDEPAEYPDVLFCDGCGIRHSFHRQVIPLGCKYRVLVGK